MLYNSIKLSLQLEFPSTYPSSNPPAYYFQAPWLLGEPQLRKQIDDALNEVYEEHRTESVGMLWIEQIRDILRDWNGRQGKHCLKNEYGSYTVILCLNLYLKIASYSTSDNITKTALNLIEIKLLFAADRGDDQDGGAGAAAQEIMPDIFQGEPITNTGGTFQGFLAEVKNLRQYEMVMEAMNMNKKTGKAKYRINAYRYCN